MNTITVDGVEYQITSLSEAAAQQLVNIQFCEGEIQRLQFLLAATQTARLNYLHAFKAAAAEKASK